MGSADELKIWGRVFERLREERGISTTEMCYRARMGLPQYRVICYKLIDGPSVQTIERLLKALDCTWGEWGITYDAMQAGLASKQEPVVLKPAVNDAPARGSSRKPPPSRGSGYPALALDDPEREASDAAEGVGCGAGSTGACAWVARLPWSLVGARSARSISAVPDQDMV